MLFVILYGLMFILFVLNNNLHEIFYKYYGIVIHNNNTYEEIFREQFVSHYVVTYGHVIFSAIWMILACFQLYNKKKSLMHKYIGYIAIVSYYIGSFFMLLLILFHFKHQLILTFIIHLKLFHSAITRMNKAIYAIRNGDIKTHEIYIKKCFSLTMTTIIIRLYMVIIKMVLYPEYIIFLATLGFSTSMSYDTLLYSSNYFLALILTGLTYKRICKYIWNV